MATNQDYKTLSGRIANSTGLATSQFLGIKIASTAGQAVLSGALNSTTGPGGFFGVLMNAPAGGEEVEFAYEGIVKLIAATSTIAVGDRVGLNSTSKATDAATTDNVFFLGRALTAASAANDIITVSLVGNGGARY